MPTYKVKVKEVREYDILVDAPNFHEASNDVMMRVEAEEVRPTHTDIQLFDVEFISAAEITERSGEH